MYKQSIILYVTLYIVAINAMDSAASNKYINQTVICVNIGRRLTTIIRGLKSLQKKAERSRNWDALARVQEKSEKLDDLKEMMNEPRFEKELICWNDFLDIHNQVACIERTIFVMSGQLPTQEDYAKAKQIEVQKKNKVPLSKHENLKNENSLTEKINTIKTMIVHEQSETVIVKSDVKQHPNLDGILDEPENKIDSIQSLPKRALLGGSFGFTGIVAIIAFYLYQLKRNNVVLSDEIRGKKKPTTINESINQKQIKNELFNCQECKA